MSSTNKRIRKKVKTRQVIATRWWFEETETDCIIAADDYDKLKKAFKGLGLEPPPEEDCAPVGFIQP